MFDSKPEYHKRDETSSNQFGTLLEKVVWFILCQSICQQRLCSRGVRTLIFWVQIQSCFANFESESNPDPAPTRHKQSDSCLSPGKYKSSKQPATSFSKHEIQIQSGPVTGKKTPLLILLEAAGIWIQKIQNPVLVHLCCTAMYCTNIANHYCFSNCWFHDAIFVFLTADIKSSIDRLWNV